jgi:hypothetical protein
MIGYMISNMGRTAKIDDNQNMYLRHDHNKFSGAKIDGYYMWHYRDIDNTDQNKFVHRIVADNFIPKPNNFIQYDDWSIDHINNNKLNNASYNLQWLRIGDNITKSNVARNSNNF